MSPAPPRFHRTRDLHFITFSCFERRPLPRARTTFEQVLERVRQWYGMFITGYVVMPEHVHLLVGEPERSTLAVALQMLKQNVACKLGVPINYRDSAAALLRLQRLDGTETSGEVEIHSSQPGDS